MPQKTTTTRLSREMRMPVTTFLRDTFLPGVQTFVTEDVEIDTRKGGQIVAPFVAPNVGGINMGRQGYQTHSYKTPLVAPQKAISKELLKIRLLGESIESQQTPEQRAEAIMQKDAADMDDAIARREELMAAQLLTTGKIEVKGYVDDKMEDYVDESIDYGFSQNTVLSGDVKWDGNASAKYDDLCRICEQVMKAGYNPSSLLLGAGSYKLLLSDESFRKKLDTSNLALASIAPKLSLKSGNGVKAIGRINDLGTDLYAYYAWYLGDDKKLHPYIPDNKILALPDEIGEFLYGAVTQVEEDKQFHTYESTRVPKEWTDVNSDTKMVRLSSRPLAHPFDIDGWATLDTY